MSGLMLNIVYEPCNKAGTDISCGKAKHKSFVLKRHMLAHKGFLKPKQNKKKNRGKKDKNSDLNGTARSNSGPVLPKFTSHQKTSSQPSSSTQKCSQKPTSSHSSSSLASSSQGTHRAAPLVNHGPLKYVAMDCEMVGTGPKGSTSELGRCSIVSYDGDVIYDKFIKPLNRVVDYRTRWSGIRRHDLVNATPFYQAQKEILKIFQGKVVVGHAIHNDFKVLKYCHPAAQTRDTARIPLLNMKAGFPENQTPSLKRLTQALFNKEIQKGRLGHSSVEDAKATMELYKVVEVEWEQMLATKTAS